MLQKEKYREFCKSNTKIPIFSRDWWMDAVCDCNNWNVILVEKGDEIVASLPYYYILQNNRLSIKQPILTQTNGVNIVYPKNQVQKYTKKLAYEKEITNLIIDQLEEQNITYYNQNFHYSYTNWLPFYWKGFSQTTRYTYVIDDLSNLDKVFLDFDSKLRNEIRKAEKLVSVKEDLVIDKFYEINKKTFERQDMKIPYSLDLLKKIDKACLEKECRKVFYAEDENGRIHAAIYIIWDENSAYYLMGGGDPELRNSDATSLLLWKAIQFASTVTKKFDFEGSMIEPIERFFRSFGTTQKHYFNIYKNYGNNSLIYIIAKDIYNNSPKLRKMFKR